MMKMEISYWGPNDLDLAVRLRKAGSDHRKFVRQIFVSVDITAPPVLVEGIRYYKVATVANSTSTMHKIHSKPFSMEDFSHDHMTPKTLAFMETVVEQLNRSGKNTWNRESRRRTGMI